MVDSPLAGRNFSCTDSIWLKEGGSSTAKISVTNFEELKEQYLLDIKAVTMMKEVPPELMLNWDHTGISIVPGSAWTMEFKGFK